MHYISKAAAASDGRAAAGSSTLGKNWKWRALPGAFTPALAQRLYRETRVYQRLPKKNAAVKRAAAKKTAQ